MGWDDPQWAEKENSWAAGFRWLQSWWRETELGLPPGPNVSSRNNRPVASNLPDDADWTAAFLTREAAETAKRLATGHTGPGIAEAERLRRSLLTSQGVAINAFAPLEAYPELLRRWAQDATGADLSHVERVDVRYEWAPDPAVHFRSGSAFDVFLDLRHGSARSFVAVEVKYAEHLASQAPRLRDDKYGEFTRLSPSWVDGAEDTLLGKSTRQLWINALLAESLLERGTEGYTAGWSVVLTCGADSVAREATTTVAALQTDVPTVPVSWSCFELLLDATTEVEALDEWRTAFRRRYLDLTPVATKLAPDDPRLSPVDPAQEALLALRAAWTTAAAIAERVLGDGSVIEQHLLGPDGRVPSITQLDRAARQLGIAMEALRQARRDLY